MSKHDLAPEAAGDADGSGKVAPNPSREADRLLDLFVAEYLNGQEPDYVAVLNSCPSSARDRLRQTLDGFLLVHRYYCSGQVRPDILEGAVERVRRIRQRKRWLRETRERASCANWDAEVTAPLERMAQLLGIVPASGSVDAPHGFAVMNRQNGLPANAPPLDAQRRRGAEAYAREEARRLWNRHVSGVVPTPLDEVADDLALVVQEALLSGIVGCLVTDGERGGIFLDHRQERRRKRFTLAHEIGHYLLHRSVGRYFSDKSADLFSSHAQMELEASAFAAELLLPTALLPRAFGREIPSFRHADEVVERFDVSLLAVLRRLVRASNYRTVLVVSKDGKVEWSDRSDEFSEFVQIVPQIARGTAAWDLLQEEEVDTYQGDASVHSWFAKGVVPPASRIVMEESRRLPGGWIYSLLTLSGES